MEWIGQYNNMSGIKNYEAVWVKERKKLCLVHRLVMEQYLGRRLLPTECVHHINGIYTDNRIDNLQVMSFSEHTLLHWRSGMRKACKMWKREPHKDIGCIQKRCENKHEGRGLCKKHYLRVLRKMKREGTFINLRPHKTT